MGHVALFIMLKGKRQNFAKRKMSCLLQSVCIESQSRKATANMENMVYLHSLLAFTLFGVYYGAKTITFYAQWIKSMLKMRAVCWLCIFYFSCRPTYMSCDIST